MSTMMPEQENLQPETVPNATDTAPAAEEDDWEARAIREMHRENSRPGITRTILYYEVDAYSLRDDALREKAVKPKDSDEPG